MRHRKLRAGLSVAALPLLAATTPAVAGAQASGAGESAMHCNFEARTGQQRCFGSVQEATADARARQGARAGEITQATLFEEKDFGGASFTVYGDGLCEKNDQVDYQINLPEDWRNRVSSVQPWGDCWIWLYPEPDLGGERDGPFKENTGDVGELMNDRTRSVGLS